MVYKRLGNTGIKVSSLCLGTMTFGDGADIDMCKKIYTSAKNRGVNHFDCANVYAGGDSERILGKLIQGQREEVILSSKVYYSTSNNVNHKGLSRLNITRELEKSLKRLKTDYLDIFYLHSYDNDTSLRESLSTLNDFVKQGKILYIGLSNFSAWQVMKAISISEIYNYAPITCIQPMYNLLKRQCESEILPMAQSESLGTFTYSPLAGGLLTGKYLDKEYNQGRFSDTGEMGIMYQERYNDEQNRIATIKFIKFCKENGYNPVSLAVAWVGSHKSITSPIIGAKNDKQLQPALDSMNIDMTPELKNKISEFSLSPTIATDRKEETEVIT